MNTQRYRRRIERARGMTMVEVLVAMAILAMMTVSVWSSFAATTKAMDEVGKIQDRYAGVRSALNRMASEISMAYLSFNRLSTETRHFTLFEGRADFDKDNLTFSNFAHLRMRMHANESDQGVIQYFVADDAENGKRQHLYRRETRRLMGDLPEDLENFEAGYVLLEDIKSLDFEYWDYINQEWLEEWQTTSRSAQPDRLPQRVKITIGIEDEDGEEEFFTTQTVLFMQEKIDFSK
jgi:general secretion pathway protein J